MRLENRSKYNMISLLPYFIANEDKTCEVERKSESQRSWKKDGEMKL